MRQQVRNFSWAFQTPAHESHGQPLCQYLIHDRDTSFQAMDEVLHTEGVEIIKTPVRVPNANAYAERFVREVRETLNNLILVGERSLYRVLKKIEQHHNQHRPHQGIGNNIPMGYDYPTQPARPDQVQCKSQLGGLLRHYYVEKEAA